jgi:hypothetical protein
VGRNYIEVEAIATLMIIRAKAHPGKISMASAGIGSGPHLAGCAPKNTPSEIIERLNREINAGLLHRLRDPTAEEV